MNALYNIYNHSCNSVQSFIQKKVTPEIPDDYVKATVKTFAYSSLWNLVLTEGNFKATLPCVGLSLLATNIYAIIIVTMEKLNALNLIRSRPLFNRTGDDDLFAITLAWGLPLILAHKIKIPINYKASFYATIPLYVWSTFSTKASPLTATVSSSLR